MPTRKTKSPYDPGPNRTGDLWFRKESARPLPSETAGVSGRRKASKVALGHKEATGARTRKLTTRAAEAYLEKRFSACSCYHSEHAVDIEDQVDSCVVTLPEGTEAFFHIIVHYGSNRPERCWALGTDGMPCKAHATRGGMLSHTPRKTLAVCNAHAAAGERAGTLTLWRRP